MMFPQNSVADWDCPVDQPTSCINQVNGYIAAQRGSIVDAAFKIREGVQAISSCWSSRDQAISNRNAAKLVLARAEGELSEIDRENEVFLRVKTIQDNQVLILEQYKNEVTPLFRDFLLSLKDQIGWKSNALFEFRTRLYNAKKEADAGAVIIFDVIIGMLNEVDLERRSRGHAADWLRKTLEAKLTTGNISALARYALTSVLSGEEISKVNLSDKLDLALNLAKQLQESILQQQLSVQVKRENKANEIAGINSSISSESRSEVDFNRICNQKEHYYRIELPAIISSNQESIIKNMNYLDNDGCKREYCTWHTPDHFISGADRHKD